jgi:hypothetical protein
MLLADLLSRFNDQGTGCQAADHRHNGCLGCLTLPVSFRPIEATIGNERHPGNRRNRLPQVAWLEGFQAIASEQVFPRMIQIIRAAGNRTGHGILNHTLGDEPRFLTGRIIERNQTTYILPGGTDSQFPANLRHNIRCSLLVSPGRC